MGRIRNLGRIAGPFAARSLPNLQCSPIGLVPKHFKCFFCFSPLSPYSYKTIGHSVQLFMRGAYRFDSGGCQLYVYCVHNDRNNS